MADQETHEGFEAADEEESEIVLLSAEEKEAKEKEEAEKKAAEGRVSLSKEEFEELRRGKDSSAAVQAGLEGLAAKLGRPAVNVPVPAQAPGESDEDFERRVERELFENGKAGKVLKETVIRTVGPILQQMLGMNAEQMKRVLAVDPEKGDLFRKYKKEVEEEYAGLSPAERLMPTGYERALDRVLERHGPELEKERIDRAVAERLKELGIEVENGQVKAGAKKAAVNEGESAGPTGVGSRKRVVLTLSAAERERLERKAEENGLEFTDYLRAIGKIKE